MNTKTLLNNLPSSWEQVTLNQFQQLSNIEINTDEQFAGIENTLAVLSILSGISIEDLESLPMKELLELGNKISFITQEPEPAKKTSLTKWKDIDSISYNDFIVFLQNQEGILSNLDVFVKQFSKTELTKEEILQLPITEVLAGFFFARQKLRRYLKLLELSTKLEIKRHKKKERQALKKT